MVSSRGLVGVSTMLVCGLLGVALAQPTSEAPLRPDAMAVLAEVRQHYQHLPAYHFDRVLLAQETRSDGTLANIAELTLTTATEGAKSRSDEEPFPPMNVDRFRLGTRTRQGEMLQVCDGETCWSYSSLKNEYTTGKRFRDVSTSVGGSMLMALHMFPFMTLQGGVIQDAKVAGEEDVEVGGERRQCHVIEGRMWPTLPPDRQDKPRGPVTLGVDWLLVMLTLQGLTDEGRATRYSPWPFDEPATGVGDPTHVTLWIDKNTPVVVRSKWSAQLYKSSLGTAGAAVEKVAVVVTDSVTLAAVKAPPADVFRFAPPEGAREVPNVASRRGMKP